MSRATSNTARPAKKEVAVSGWILLVLLAMATAPLGVLTHGVEHILRISALALFVYYVFFIRKRERRRPKLIVMPIWALLAMIMTTFGFWYWLYTLSAGFLLIGVLAAVVAAGYLAD